MDYTLKKGAHTTPQDGMCAMEFAAHIAGEPHSDKPKCVDPTLAAFMRDINDHADEVSRQKLKPYLVRAIGTAGDGKAQEREDICAEWAQDYNLKYVCAIDDLNGYVFKEIPSGKWSFIRLDDALTLLDRLLPNEHIEFLPDMQVRADKLLATV